MRPDLPGVGRRRLLLSESKGFHPGERGMRKKKTVRGNTVSQDIVQINMKVIKHGSRSIDQLIKTEEKKEKAKEKPKEEAKVEEVKEKTKEESKEETKEEVKRKEEKKEDKE
jgi:small subunit ribosomal protein S6e